MAATIVVSALLRDRLDNPCDDMLTMIANAEIDGEPVGWDLKVGYINLLIVAGIDTTWSAIGSGLWHFGQHPDQVARLVEVDEPDAGLDDGEVVLGVDLEDPVHPVEAHDDPAKPEREPETT